MSDTQKMKIVDYIVQNGSITTFEAFLDLNITKLTTRISELRRDGYDIISDTVYIKDSRGKVVSKYNRYRFGN